MDGRIHQQKAVKQLQIFGAAAGFDDAHETEDLHPNPTPRLPPPPHPTAILGSPVGRKLYVSRHQKALITLWIVISQMCLLKAQEKLLKWTPLKRCDWLTGKVVAKIEEIVYIWKFWRFLNLYSFETWKTSTCQNCIATNAILTSQQFQGFFCLKHLFSFRPRGLWAAFNQSVN